MNFGSASREIAIRLNWPPPDEPREREHARAYKYPGGGGDRGRNFHRIFLLWKLRPQHLV
jgi:hypothetical protein